MDSLTLVPRDDIDTDVSSIGPATTNSNEVRVLERSIYRGPNIFSLRPMVRVRIDIGSLETSPSNTLPGFSDRMLDLLPGLRAHHCSKGHAGGFVERLETGTWFGHIAEHVALELQSLAGAAVTRGKTRSVRGRPGTYDLLVEYRDEQAALLSVRHALTFLVELLPGRTTTVRDDKILPTTRLGTDASVDDRVAEIASLVRAGALGPSTQAIVDAARRRGIPVSRLDEQSLLQLGYGRRQRRVRASITV
ncbi:hypothetical protein [Sphingomonas sp. 3P27F8]|uniref:cyanophycin synthetase family protein n=1 Tax=Sphingomonas sp. 3P27F8 TaxID=2502213 RepID=UPI0020162C5C|nr:hypothetical protein [Sphingomonas sp. 3P27F8]